MISCIKNHPLKFIFVVLLTVILSLNYFGLCYSQKRFLSDEEKLNIIIENILSSEAESFKYYKSVILLDKNNERRIQLEKEYPGEPVPYRDINEFFILNPKCCTVSDKYIIGGYEYSIAHITFWSRLIRAVSLVITIKYLERYRDSEGIIHTKPISHDWVIGNCGDNHGDVWEHDNLWTHFE